MDGNVQRRKVSLDEFPADNDSDSDSISITSPIEPEEPSDTEFVVEGVHAEREQETNGERKKVFLVEWANFPLDQCTWEPLDNLPDELTKQWEEKKAVQDPSVALEFEAQYEAAFKVKLEEAKQLHRRRNAKRRKHGIRPTSFWFRNVEHSDSEDERSSDQRISDSDATESGEAEDNDIDHQAAAAVEKSNSSTKTNWSGTSRPQNRIFTYQSGKSLLTDRKTANTQWKDSAEKVLTDSSNPREVQRTKSNKRTSRDREMPSATGYQGSAWKPSSGDPSCRPVEAVTPKFGSVKSTPSRLVSAGAPTRMAPAGAVASVGSAMMPVPSSSSATASSQAATKGRLTATKTAVRKSPLTSVNIFSAGKRARTRKALGDIELDSQQKTKFYSKLNQRQKSAMRSRERADQAPPIDKIAPGLFAPGSTVKKAHVGRQERVSNDFDDDQVALSSAVKTIPPSQQQHAPTGITESEGGQAGAAEGPQESSTLSPLQVAGSSVVADGPANPDQEPKRPRSSFASITDRPNKKAKTVRFTDVEVGLSPPHDQSAFQHLSALYKERFHPKDEAFPRITDNDDTIVKEPMETDDIANSTRDRPLCTPTTSAAGTKNLAPATYKSKRGQSVAKRIQLSTSRSILNVTFDSIPTSITSDTDQQWLNDFLGTDRLDVGHMFLAETLITQLPTLASHKFRPLCSGMVISDGNSDSLEVVAKHLRAGPYGLFMAQARFNLILFPSNSAEFDKLSDFGMEPTSPESAAIKYFMFSSAIPIFQLMRPSSSTVEGLKAYVGKEKLLLFPTILGMQYSQLTAPVDKARRKSWHFYLAFPERAVDWQKSIGSWLSIRDPACKVYTSFHGGSWLAFFDVVKREKKDGGAIIIHEALVPFIRRFPYFHKLLIKTSVVVWLFTESLGSETPRPLSNTNIVPVLSARFSRMFPIGSVILVTPSFLVSEPQQAYKLLKWFFDARAKFPHNKLVVAHNIVDYLSKLSSEKTDLRTKLSNGLWSYGRLDKIRMDESMGALAHEDLVARQMTWLHMDHWMSQQMDSEVPFSESNSVIFADRSIDPNDEQSLVNWFGSWSMAHIQEFRKFYVVGSSSKLSTNVVHTLTDRASRMVEVPKYDPLVLSDPDEALQRTSRAAEASRAQHNSQPQEFESVCFQNDENQMSPWLTRQFAPYFVTLYNNAVSWADVDMANHFDDSVMQFATIKQWWNSVIPWAPQKNTQVAFFYTISDEWRPENFPRGIKPRRHPWIAIWRPSDVHQPNTYKRGNTELIIWDVRAGDELEKNHTLRLHDLTWMQRALVEYIQIHAHEKNPNGYLQRVWMGGFAAHRAALSSPLPVDISAEWLMDMMKNVQDCLPATEWHLRNRQYRQLIMSIGQPLNSAHSVELANTELGTGGQYDSDVRIIFHPPRAGERLEPRSSQCTNALYETARQFRRRSPYTKEMVYTFPSTMHWYQKQEAEGRHFEHILVDEWEKIFQAMKVGVDRSTTAPPSTSAEQAPQAHPRPDSTGSGG